MLFRSYPEWFYVIGQENLLGVPAQLWLLLIAIVVTGIILDRTTFGRTLYAIGNNETAARFAGLRVGRIKLIVYSRAWHAFDVLTLKTPKQLLGHRLEYNQAAAEQSAIALREFLDATLRAKEQGN